MATPINLARFTINGTPSEDVHGNRGVDVTPGEVLAITLEKNPAAGANLVTYELPNRVDANAPLSSLFDTQQVFTESGTSKVTSDAVNATFHITVNASTDISSYVIRCTAVTPQGAQVWERMIVVRKSGLRMTTPAERAEYQSDGWSDAMNELTKAMADGGTTVPTVSASHVGTVAAFPAGVPRILTSDGATPGGVWATGSFLPAGVEGSAAYYTGGSWTTKPFPVAGTVLPTPSTNGQTPYYSTAAGAWALSAGAPTGGGAGLQYIDPATYQVEWIESAHGSGPNLAY